MTLITTLVALACGVAVVWRIQVAWQRGYDAGYADAIEEAIDAADLVCRQAWRASEWERN